MLSILIPTYNYNVISLVSEIHKQAVEAKIEFEILVYDDGSLSPLNIINKNINLLKNCTFKELPKNIGRSAIRNLLANNATYDWVLFLDADTKIISKNFIQIYLNHIKPHNQIIYGGICYQKNKPNNNQMLRWVYGNKREALKVSDRNKNPYLRFLTLNFLSKKTVFRKLKFDTDIPNLRHEDTLFALGAKKKNINIKHINNPVLHLGLESSFIFLKKSEEATNVLYSFVKQKLIEPQNTLLSRRAELLVRYKLHHIVVTIYSIIKKPLKNQLLSNTPSLILFDFYRLGYYLSLSK